MIAVKRVKASQLCLQGSEQTSREYGAGTAHQGSQAQSYTSLQAWLGLRMAHWALRSILLLYSWSGQSVPWHGAGLFDWFLPTSLLPYGHHNTASDHELFLRNTWCLLLQPGMQLRQWLGGGRGRMCPKCWAGTNSPYLKNNLSFWGKPRLPKM